MHRRWSSGSRDLRGIIRCVGREGKCQGRGSLCRSGRLAKHRCSTSAAQRSAHGNAGAGNGSAIQRRDARSNGNSLQTTRCVAWPRHGHVRGNAVRRPRWIRDLVGGPHGGSRARQGLCIERCRAEQHYCGQRHMRSDSLHWISVTIYLPHTEQGGDEHKDERFASVTAIFPNGDENNAPRRLEPSSNRRSANRLLTFRRTQSFTNRAWPITAPRSSCTSKR